MTALGSSPRIAFVAGLCVGADAISGAVKGSMTALQRHLNARCRLFTFACDSPELDTTITPDSSDLIFDPFFCSADLIFYHFGVYNSLFNAILVGNGRAKQIVRYHNITPKEFLPASSHATIDRSIGQLGNMGDADEIWADSEFNKQDLLRYGIDQNRIRVMPLFDKFSDDIPTTSKASMPIELLYVGRFVQSKGVLDLIEALGKLPPELKKMLRVTLVGNIDFSDSDYIAKVLARISKLELESVVSFRGKVDDDELKRCYERAHIFVIPSYHEGFCVPLIEAMRHHCVPIGYAAGNVPSLISNLGLVVETGHIEQLAAAIEKALRYFVCVDQEADVLRTTVPWCSEPMTKQDYFLRLDDYLKQYSYDAFVTRISERALQLLPANPSHS